MFRRKYCRPFCFPGNVAVTPIVYEDLVGIDAIISVKAVSKLNVLYH